MLIVRLVFGFTVVFLMVELAHAGAAPRLSQLPIGYELVAVAKLKSKAVADATRAPQVDPAEAALFAKNLAKAKNGDREAMGAVEYAYRFGSGVAKDESQSIFWARARHRSLVTAAEGGDTDAMSQLSSDYASGSRAVVVDKGKAAQWYERRKAKLLTRAEGGDKNAMEALSSIYEESDYGRADYGKAVSWLMKAAEAGSYSAMSSLADKYDHGIDIPADRAKAFYWYSKAAANPGDAWSARIELANKYKTGDGVAKSLEEAAKLHVAHVENQGGWRKHMRAEGFASEVARSEKPYHIAVQRELIARELFFGADDGEVSDEMNAAVKRLWRRKAAE